MKGEITSLPLYLLSANIEECSGRIGTKHWMWFFLASWFIFTWRANYTWSLRSVWITYRIRVFKSFYFWNLIIFYTITVTWCWRIAAEWNSCNKKIRRIIVVFSYVWLFYVHPIVAKVIPASLRHWISWACTDELTQLMN